jgi:uncharacterized protein
MSQDGVRVVQALFEAWASRGLDAAAEFMDPEIEWRAAEGALDDVGEMRGKDALRAYLQDWLDDFDDLAFEPEEVIDAGEHVIAKVRMSGRAKGSGVETELRFFTVCTVRDGKVVKGREFWTREEALAAAG